MMPKKLGIIPTYPNRHFDHHNQRFDLFSLISATAPCLQWVQEAKATGN
jgi:hypothetical protein